MKDKFNRYCAEVVGYEVNDSPSFLSHCINVTDSEGFGIDYKPYDDLNQMAEVVEKLIEEEANYIELIMHLMPFKINSKGTKQAFRDFIISTMPAGEDDA